MIRTLVLSALALAAGCRSAELKPPPAPADDLPVTVVTWPEQTVLALAHTGPYSEMDAQVERLYQEMESRELVPQGHLAGVFFDDPASVPPDRTRYEVRMPVAAGTTAEAPFVVTRVPRTTTAAVVLVGPYDEISAWYPRLYDWIDEHGHEVAGPLIEVYLVNPGSGGSPSGYETEVHVPIR